MLGGMKVSRGIIVFGANGSGKTTLGCELAQALKFKHIDVEDYYFEKADIFYENPRTKDDVIHLMLTDIEKHGSFVLSGVTGDYGKNIVSMYKLGVLLSAPVELRMERIRNRAIYKHGERALPNGDMYENRESFIAYARERDLSVIDQWSSTLTCPIIHLDATMPISHNTRKIIDVYCTL